MNDKTLKALKGSIKKWIDIWYRGGEDRGYDNCPLCKLFNVHDACGITIHCNGCPVQNHTHLSGCSGTPYPKWGSHQYDDHGNPDHQIVICDECKHLAEDEIKFLKSLLPRDK